MPNAPSVLFAFSLGILSLGVLTASCGTARADHPEPGSKPLAVPVAPAHVEMLDSLYRASGTVHGHTTATLTSRTMGNVRAVNVRSGDHVKAGQVLVTLEATDLGARVHGASTGVDQATQGQQEAEDALASAEALARNAREARDRAAKLLAAQAIPQQAFDDAEARARSATAQEQAAKARVRSSKAHIEQAKAELADARAQLGYAQITAPFSGRIAERRVDPGNLASPGTPLIVLEADDHFRIEVPVEESRADALHLGDEASVELTAGAPAQTAHIDEIVPSVDPGSRASIVKLSLPSNVTALRPGMFARVTFRVGQRKGLVVPTGAVNVLGALERVFVVDGDHARLRMITTGDTNGHWTEVLSGLSADEPVVATPPPGLRDGALIARAQ